MPDCRLGGISPGGAQRKGMTTIAITGCKQRMEATDGANKSLTREANTQKIYFIEFYA